MNNYDREINFMKRRLLSDADLEKWLNEMKKDSHSRVTDETRKQAIRVIIKEHYDAVEFFKERKY